MLIILFLSTLFGNAAARTATPTLHLVNPFHKHCLTHGQPRVRAAFQVMSPLKRSADGLSVLKQKTSLHHAGIDLSFVGSTTTTCQRLISALPPSPTTTSPSLNALACLRGGAVLPLLVLESIPTQSAKTTLALSKVLTACTFITGMFLLTAPVAYTKKMFGISSEVKEDTFESSLLQAIGAIVVGFAIHVYLTLVQTLSNDGMSVVTVGHAMGYSLLPRILIILFSFLQKGKEDYQFKGSNFLKVNFAMMSWTSFSLLTVRESKKLGHNMIFGIQFLDLDFILVVKILT